MPDTFTTNYNWTKPAIGADSGTWGGLINSDLDGIDSTVFSVSGVANAALPKAGGTLTGALAHRAGAAAAGSAPAYFQAGVVLTTPEAHAMEWDGTHAFLTQSTGPTRKQIAFVDDAITGSAAKLTTARSIAMSGDVVWSVSFDGSANVTAAGTIQNGAVTGAKLAAGAVANSNLANMPAHTYKGNNAAASGAPVDLTSTQMLNDLGTGTSSIGASGYVTLPGGLVMQWGDIGAQNAGATGSVTFPLAFPTRVSSIILKEVSSTGNTGTAHLTASPSLTGFGWQLSGNSNAPNIFWIAIGN